MFTSADASVKCLVPKALPLKPWAGYALPFRMRKRPHQGPYTHGRRVAQGGRARHPES